jgi:hypothetical protein
MTEFDHRLRLTADTQQNLVTRPQVFDAGGSDRCIAVRNAGGRWSQPQEGVYLIGGGPLSWEQALLAACLAAGPEAVASHRAAAMLWELDVCRSAPIELTAPHDDRPAPAQTLTYRSRQLDPADRRTVRGIPVHCVEGTILDLASRGVSVVVEKAVEAALRKGLTTETALDGWLGTRSRRGRKGTTLLRQVLEDRSGQRPAGSGGEVELLRLLRLAGVPDPVRQHLLQLGRGEVAVLDLAWPNVRAAAELHGWDGHGPKRAWRYTVARARAIRARTWEYEEFVWADVADHPGPTATSILAMLARAKTRVATTTTPIELGMFVDP